MYNLLFVPVYSIIKQRFLNPDHGCNIGVFAVFDEMLFNKNTDMEFSFHFYIPKHFLSTFRWPC